MSSLSGGLLPMKGVGSPTSSSTLDNMAPLAPLSTKSTVSKVKNEFDDMFDDLLDAPVPTKMKKSKSKSRKSSKSSSKKSSKNYDDYDYGDVPLSPELGQSMDSFKYDAPGNKFTAPSNINEADLDDSILGGLFGGGSSKPKGIIKKNTPIEESRPKTTTNASAHAAADSDKGEYDKPYRSTSPEVKTTRPSTTGSRRPRNQSSFPAGGAGNGHDDDDLFNFNTKPATTVKTTSSMKDDFDDSFEIPDLDDIHHTHTQKHSAGSGNSNNRSDFVEKTEAQRPSTTVGRRPNSLWGGGDDSDDRASSGRGKDLAGSSYAPAGSRPSTGGRRTSSNLDQSQDNDTDHRDDARQRQNDSHKLQQQHSNHHADNQDDSIDFDIDSLLPDNSSSAAAPKSTSYGSSQPAAAAAAASTATLMPHLPAGPHSSKSRSPSPSKTHLSSNNSGSLIPAASPVESAVASPLLGAGGSGGRKKASSDDDVDIGFMPSFLEAGRESRSRRQIGRSQSARGRLGGKASFPSSDVNNDDSLDALDMALGAGGDNVKKVNDPFAQVDTKPQGKSAAVSSSEQSSSSSTTNSSSRSHRLSRSTSPTKEQLSSLKSGGGAPSEQSSSSGYTNLPQLGSPRGNGLAEQGSTSTSTPSKDREGKSKDKSKEKDKDKDREKEKNQQRNSTKGLTVTIDVPSDKPLSNPPTVTAITPASGRHRGSDFSPDPAPRDQLDESHGSVTSPTQLKSELSTTQHSVSFTKKLTSSSPPLQRTLSASSTEGSTGGGGSAKKILKNTSHSHEDSAQIGGGGGQRRERRNSHDAVMDTSYGAEDLLSASMSSPNVSSKRNKPSWLSSGGPDTLHILDSSMDSTPHQGKNMTMSGDPSVRLLQQRLDEVMIQKETIEKYMRAEIEVLKNKVATTSQAHSQGSSSDSLGPDQAVELQNLKIKAAALAEENARLKEEAVVEKIRHQKELMHVRDRHSADMECGNASRAQELEMVERRHKEALLALKSMHMDELQAVKQRAKDGAALEHLSSQITTTTGSLKLIEEQMSLQYRGVDAVREGQFEARERLLKDMETQAREKAEAAELESFKVKGLLSHMDQVVANLRNQGGEERERLRLEHRRLEAMQASLDSERRVIHERFNEEMQQMKRKLAAAEEVNRSDQAARSEQLAEVAEMKRKLEGDKKEFAVYVTTSVKAAERGAQHLKEEESRLLVLQEEIRQEQSLLNQRKAEAEDQLKHAADWNRSIQQAKHNIQCEREGLEDLAVELQAMSDVLVERDAKFAQREQDIQAREGLLQEEKSAIDAAYGMLQSKEKELSHFHLHADQQRMAMKQLEDEMLERRVVVSTRQRELAKVQHEDTTRRLQIALGSLQSGGDGGGTTADIRKQSSTTFKPSAGNGQSNGSGRAGAGREKENFNVQTAFPRSSGGHSSLESAKVSPIHMAGKSHFNANFEEELASAQHTLQKARGGVAKISHTNQQRDAFLRSENEFVSKFQHRRV